MYKKYYLLTAIAAVVFLSVWTAYGKGQRENPIRQNWEYKIYSMYRKTGEVGWSERYEDGKLITVASGESKIKEFGEQGWELVTVTSISSSSHNGYEGYNNEGVRLLTTPSYAGFTNQMFFYFKRPK